MGAAMDAEPPHSGPSHSGLEPVVIAVLLLLAELTMIGGASMLRVSEGWLIPGHIVIMAGLLGWLGYRTEQGRDTRLLVVLALATLVAGPIGAALSLVFLPFAARRTKDSHLLDAWYARIAQAVTVDAATRLSDDVATGRTLAGDAPVPIAFARVMEQGTLEERQSALGLIARKFHPDYAPALAAALKSSEPVVRVQAAAVAARVRRDLQARVRTMLGEVAGLCADPAKALAAAADLDGAVRSRLLDEGDRVRALAAVARLRKAGADGSRTSPGANGGRLERASALALEDELLGSGRFAEFRNARRRRRIGEHGRFIIRKLDARATAGTAGRA